MDLFPHKQANEIPKPLFESKIVKNSFEDILFDFAKYQKPTYTIPPSLIDQFEEISEDIV